jgi:hypothetical protein
MADNQGIVVREKNSASDLQRVSFATLAFLRWTVSVTASSQKKLLFFYDFIFP